MKVVLSVFIGILLALFVLVVIVYFTIRNLLDKHGFRDQTLRSIYERSKLEAMRDKSRIKQVSGMTNVLLPNIKTFFKEFDEKEMYLLTEKSIRTILGAIESGREDSMKDDDLSLISQKIILQIRDLNRNDIKYKYQDIKFHNHAIKDFQKDDAKASITISSSLEYYYEEIKGTEIIKKEQYKKQTRYQTSFIYIYDAVKAGYDIKAIGLNCPNCGGPINGFNQNVCKYCKTGINISSLDFKKCWKIIDISEDY